MLTVIEIQQREQIQQIQDQFDPNQDTWIVSDLKSKLDIQNQILSKNNSYQDQSVLRISDLWQKILHWKAPHLKIVSEDFAQILIADFLSNYKNELEISDKNLKSIFSYIHLFAPILFHARGQEQILEWFEHNQNSAIRWKKWYLIAQLSVKYLLDEKNVICRPWIACYLQNEINLGKFWQRKMFIDLGSELSKVEAQLLQQFKQLNEIIVICPKPEWDDKYKYLKSSYDDLYSSADKIIYHQRTNVQNIDAGHIHFKKTKQLRFSGMLSEVKHVVSQVRQWLDQGIPATSIAIITANIETYWPILNRYFIIEGIPVQKETTTRLISFQNVSQWLAQIRLTEKQNFKFSDFNQFYFKNIEKTSELSVSYEKLKALFSQVFSLEDLSYLDQLNLSDSKKLTSTDSFNHRLTREQFVSFVINQWDSTELDHLEIVVNELISMADEQISMELKSWIRWLESIVLKKEVLINKANSTGIHLVKVQSAHSNEFTHRLFLNLSDESLKVSGAIHLHKDDYFAIQKDLGFCLYHPDQSQLEYELQFISEMNSASEDHYCFSQTDLTGQLLTPSQFWLQFGDQHQLSLPHLTRLDEIQHLQLPNKNVSTERIQMDYNPSLNSVFQWKNTIHLSPTAVEDYHQCPFVFAAKKYFHLEDESVIDLDADTRTNGVIIHKMYEKVILQKQFENDSQFDEVQFVEQVLDECDFKISAKQIRHIYVKKYVRVLKKYLHFERQWRKQYSEMRTTHCEASFSFYLDLHTLNMRKKTSNMDHANEHEILFTGKIDRIDQIGIQDLVIYDYKSSTDKFHQFKSWLQNDEFQLLIYMLVIQTQMIENLPHHAQVGGAFFYHVKKFDFDVGILRGDLQDRVGLFKKSFASVAQSTIDDYLIQLKEKLKITSQRIINGELSPAPGDLLQCHSCKWSRLCRAVHLN